MFRSLIAVVLIAGCAGGASDAVNKPLHVFPSKQQLSELAEQHGAPLAANVVELEAWQLELPALDAQTPAHAVLPLVAPGAAPTPALDCVAHELGRILLRAPAKTPSQGLQRFIAARCGAVVQSASLQSWTLPSSSTAETDAALIARLTKQLKAAARPTGNAATAGAALVRDEQRAVVVVTQATPQVRLEPFSTLIGTDSVVEIRGRLLFESDDITAYVNSGELAVHRCERDASLPLPRFALRCPVTEGVDAEWVQVTALPKGRVIGRVVLETIAVRQPDAAKVYRARRVGDGASVTDSAAFAAHVLEHLNRLRTSSGMSALTLATSQSQTAAQMTPHLFATSDPLTSEGVDRVALGLMAGWDVSGGTIRDARIVTNLSVDSLDPGRWLADMLDMPIGRAVLLEPNIDALAIGASLQKQPRATAAVALTYSFFKDEAKPGELAERVLDRLAHVRSARKLGDTRRITDAPDLPLQLARVHGGQVAPPAALDALMQRMVQVAQRDVRGLVWETHDLDAIEFPEELLRPGNLAIAAGVTYHRAPGGAWGQYCVLFVIVEQPAEVRAQTASRASGGM